jgi:hypothetical protein
MTHGVGDSYGVMRDHAVTESCALLMAAVFFDPGPSEDRIPRWRANAILRPVCVVRLGVDPSTVAEPGTVAGNGSEPFQHMVGGYRDGITGQRVINDPAARKSLMVQPSPAIPNAQEERRWKRAEGGNPLFTVHEAA